MNNSIQIV